MKFQRNVPLKNHTTFRIGGQAKYFYVAKTKDDLIEAIKIAKKKKLPFFVLGGGSNVLVSDKGYPGLVIKYQSLKLSKFVKKGLDWAAGVPGTIAGAVRGNAGAFGKSMQDAVKEVEVFDAKTEKIKIFKNKDCQFSYRSSIFKKNPNLIILSVKIKTKRPNLKKIQEYLNYRKVHHPQEPSAGSVFKNFQFTHCSHTAIFNFQSLVKKFPEFKQFQKRKNIPAAFLIFQCGLLGKKIGEAQISEKHPNFIINLGNAKAKDVLRLINLIKKRVEKKFKIKLEEEIQKIP